jgi:anti-anti-sigma factor
MHKLIQHQSKDDTIIITIVHDSLDLYNSRDIYTKCLEAINAFEYHKVIIDLNSLTYIDSVGIGMLMEIKKQLSPKKIEIIIVCDIKSILQVFDLLNFRYIFQVVPTINNISSTANHTIN